MSAALFGRPSATRQALHYSSAVYAQARRVAELEQQIEKRDQVIGELTIANRILKKYTDGSR